MEGWGRFDCTAMCDKRPSKNLFPKGGVMVEQIIPYLDQKDKYVKNKKGVYFFGFKKPRL